jgi:hypothetical protein
VGKRPRLVAGDKLMTDPPPHTSGWGFHCRESVKQSAHSLPDAAAVPGPRRARPRWPRRRWRVDVAAADHRERRGLTRRPSRRSSRRIRTGVPSPSRWTWRQIRPVNSPRVTRVTCGIRSRRCRGGAGARPLAAVASRWLAFVRTWCYSSACCRCRANTGGQTEYQPDNIDQVQR